MKDKRLIALIDPGMMKQLKAQAKADKVSVAEIVRRAIFNFLAK